MMNLSSTQRLDLYRAGEVALVYPNALYQLWQITGPDAASFLQNRTSNDVALLEDGCGHLNAVLDKKAKLEGLLLLGKAPQQTDGFWAMVDNTIAESTHTALFQFKLMNDFSVDVVSRQQCVGLHGPQALALLATAMGVAQTTLTTEPYGLLALSTQLFGDVLIWAQPLTGQPGVWVWGQHEAITALQGVLMDSDEVATVDTKQMSVLALEAGLPLVGDDVGLGRLLPETGLEQVAASTTKGCYLGQETIARVATYGAVQQALVLLAAPTLPSHTTPADCAGQPIHATGVDKPVGMANRWVFSPVLGQWCISAYMDKDSRLPGKVIDVTVGDGAVFSVTVHLLPLVQPPSVEDMLHDGLRAYANNNDAEALTLLRQALGLAPKHPDVLEALGAVLSRQGQYAEAITLMESLINIEPDRVMAYTNLSVCHMELGDKEAAEDAKAQATVVAMRAQMQKGMQQKANAAEEAAKQEAQRKQLEDRVQMFHDALAHSPDDALGNFGLGSTLLELGRYTEAADALKKTVDLPTSQSAAYLKLGQAYEGAQQLEAAKAIYDAGIQVASRRRDLQPLKELEQRRQQLAN